MLDSGSHEVLIAGVPDLASAGFELIGSTTNISIDCGLGWVIIVVSKEALISEEGS